MHFHPSPNIPLQRQRQQRTAQQHDQQYRTDGHALHCRIAGGILKPEERGSHNASHDHHRLQPDKAALEEGSRTHPVPTVIVCIADDEARKHEEEIDCQIAMIDNLVQMVAAGMRFQQMKGHYHSSRHAAQSVQNLVVRLRGQIRVLYIHWNVKMYGST